MAFLVHLARAVEARDPDSSGHALRVMILAEIIAARLGWDGERAEVLRVGAALHDIGKRAVSVRVLSKEGPLSEAELAHVQSHAETGARLVGLFTPLCSAVPCVLHHHERWDGLGYPTGTEGCAIPLGARILSVVDAFDAMTSDRPYRRALPSRRAIAELGRCTGTQFDPEIVHVFVEAWKDGSLAAAFPPPAALSA